MRNDRGINLSVVRAVALGLCACGGEPPVDSIKEAITGEWFGPDSFDNLTLGNLVPQDGWSLIQDQTESPNVTYPDNDPNTQFGKVVKLVNKGAFSSAHKGLRSDGNATGSKQIFVFRARVNEQVDHNGNNKASVVIENPYGGAIVKIYFTGLGMTLCGSPYDITSCKGLFTSVPFQRIWYRVVIIMDFAARTATAKVGPVGQADITSQTVPILDEPMVGVGMWEFARSGAVLLDYMLGYPAQ
jgi:hypothetical protein